MVFDRDVLKIDISSETDRICDFIDEKVGAMKRDGAVIGISGGIDSAVAAALCVKALGKGKVLGLILPERESNSVSVKYAVKQAARLGMKTETVEITPALEAIGTYRRRDKFIRDIFPEYTPQYKSKITLPADLLSRDAYNLFTLTIADGEGNIRSARLDRTGLQGIIAATDTKQRTRMLYLYLYAESNNYLVCGTTNRSEYVQGFFVKYGDGGVDIEPIAHLYKTQVYRVAEYLGVIREIIEREPSPDTFSLTLSDEDFYFRMPYDRLDPLLFAWENAVPVSEVCEAMSLTEQQVRRAFRDFNAKANATKHLRDATPMLGADIKKARDTALI